METVQTVQGQENGSPVASTPVVDAGPAPQPELITERKPAGSRRPTGNPPGRPRKDGKPAGSVKAVAVVQSSPLPDPAAPSEPAARREATQAAPVPKPARLHGEVASGSNSTSALGMGAVRRRG